MLKKIEEFQKIHDEAVNHIHLLAKPGKYEPQMDGLVRWMLETDSNPYAYLQEQWAVMVSTAEGFSGLIHAIHHALYDDGDITFVSVNDEPRIVFCHRGESWFRNQVLSQQEQEIEKRWDDEGRGTMYEIKVLNIMPNEFGPLYDEYQRKFIKRCFLGDSCRSGNIEHTANHYREYKCFDEAWIKEAEELLQNPSEDSLSS